MSEVFKIAVGAGHGYNTAGKRSPADEREWSFNDKVVVAFIKEIKKYQNVEVRRMDDPTGKTDVPLITRTKKANSWGADIYYSSHHNAFKSKWGNHGGTETFYSKGSVNGKRLAELIHKAQMDAYGLRDRGLKTNNLHITRETRMPAVLSEGGFMDSTIDIKKLRDSKVLEQAGINIAHAVAEYGGLKLKSGNTASKPSKPAKPSKPSKPSTSGKKSINTIAKEVLAGDWGNNPKRKDALVKAGYDYSEIQAEVNRLDKEKKAQSKPKPTPTGKIGKGSKVKIKSGAKKYATGENIPNGVKGRTYTVHQNPRTRNGKKEVLLSEIMSWAYESDLTLQGGGTTVSKPKPTPSKPKKKFNLPSGNYWHKTPQFNGDEVREIQRALSSIYFYPEKGAKNNGIDGYYGAKTANAVKRFQSMYGLKEDGIYGAATRKKLDDLLN